MFSSGGVFRTVISMPSSARMRAAYALASSAFDIFAVVWLTVSKGLRKRGVVEELKLAHSGNLYELRGEAVNFVVGAVACQDFISRDLFMLGLMGLQCKPTCR